MASRTWSGVVQKLGETEEKGDAAEEAEDEELELEVLNPERSPSAIALRPGPLLVRDHSVDQPGLQ